MSSYRMKYRIGSTQYNIPVQEDISAIPLGTILPYSANSLNPPAGFLFCDGSAVSRTMYPDLFALIGTTFGSGDGVSTFNLPDLTLGEFLEGSSTAGIAKSAGLPNIKGHLINQYYEYKGGAFYGTSTKYNVTLATGGVIDQYNAGFDASRYSSVYKDDVTTVQPKSVTVRYIIKAFNATTSSSELIDITQYASELNQKADYRTDFVIIYPNEGSENSPANVTINSSYVVDNPFPGYSVNCVAEVYYENKWAPTGWLCGYHSTRSWISFGIKANPIGNDHIVVQTGYEAVLTQSHLSGNPFQNNSISNPTTLPCRVKVWKIGKIQT